jgi:predicted nucleic acid-binding Zn ribbon protein
MAPRTCPNCNAKVRPRITFCVRCGYEFGWSRSGQDPLKIVAFLIMGALLLVIVVLTVIEHR